MNRRTIFLLSASIFAIVPAGVCGNADQPAAATERDHDQAPNIVLIVADDLGYGELGCYGQQKIRTPNLDRLAAEGMRLTRHYSGSPVCAPSRCVLMTGMHPGHATIRNNSEHQPEGQKPIRAEDVTMAELLSARGYTCGGFGKWGLGYPGSVGDPLNQGFDRFFGYNCQRHAHSYYPDYLWSDDERITLANDPPIPGHAKLPDDADPEHPASYEPFEGADYAPDRINAEVIEFIRTAIENDEQFFCYYPSIIPHLALHVPDGSLKEYRGLWDETPFTGGGGYTPSFTPRATYAAMITRLDLYVGRVLDVLDELDVADNTIVIFTSDNGPTHLNKEVDVDFFNSAGGLRGLKGSVFEGGVRVPAIVRWPDRIEAGSTNDRVTGFEDWLPTLLEFAGAPVPDDVDGVSFATTLLGGDQPPRDFLYREFHGYGGQQALWVGEWKAVRRNLHRQGIRTQLFRLESDAAETEDVAEEHPAVLSKMEAVMRREHVPSTRFPIEAIDAPVDDS